MTYEFFSLTDPGRIRSNNEDAVTVDARTGLAVLADGMGGYNAGEVASAMATAFVQSDLARWLGEAAPDASDSDVRRAMELCVDHANHAVFTASNANPHYAGMGTTLVLGVFRAGRVLMGHIGDSRAYRWRGGMLSRLTKDHSLLQEQIDAGLVSPELAHLSANRNLVTRALGVEEGVLLDIRQHDVAPGDWFLLCSDGLTDMVADAEIAELLGSSQDVADAGRALVDTANTAGGRDNISIVLVRASGAAPGNRPWWSRWKKSF